MEEEKVSQQTHRGHRTRERERERERPSAFLASIYEFDDDDDSCKQLHRIAFFCIGRRVTTFHSLNERNKTMHATYQ